MLLKAILFAQSEVRSLPDNFWTTVLRPSMYSLACVAVVSAARFQRRPNIQQCSGQKRFGYEFYQRQKYIK